MQILQVKAATCRFGSLTAVDHVSMTVRQGELRAIIGPNGAGKTTFFNLISGHVRPTSGQIVFYDEDVTALAPAVRVARGMARTFQITQIFPDLTVRENLRIPVEIAAGRKFAVWVGRRSSAETAIRIDELLQMGGLSGVAGRLAGELSHGDQRAAEIMMALALRPKLLLLDEPTAGMGEHETFAVARLVKTLHRDLGLTVVLIEHDMRMVFNLAENITVLDRGRLLTEGTPREIAANEAVQAAYLGKAA